MIKNIIIIIIIISKYIISKIILIIIGLNVDQPSLCPNRSQVSQMQVAICQACRAQGLWHRVLPLMCETPPLLSSLPQNKLQVHSSDFTQVVAPSCFLTCPLYLLPTDSHPW